MKNRPKNQNRRSAPGPAGRPDPTSSPGAPTPKERPQDVKRRRRQAVRAAREIRALTGEPVSAESLYRRLNDPGARPDGFTCRHCGQDVPWHGGGTDHRNHCPRCLRSLHLDILPGDRAAECEAVMEPIAVWVRRGGDWCLIHRCTECGALSSNRVAADDNVPLLLSLAARPLAAPPFPLDRWEEP